MYVCFSFDLLPMEFLPSSGDESVTILKEVPSHYKRYCMTAAAPYYMEGSFGYYLRQRVTVREAGIQLNLFHMHSDATLDPFTQDPVQPLHFMLEGNIRCELIGFGEAWLRQGIYNLFYVPGGVRHHAWFTPGFYRSFHVDFSPMFLQELAIKYPELKEVLDRFYKDSAAGIQQHDAHITPWIESLIDKMITKCPPTEPELSIFLRSMAFRLLLLYVQDNPAEEELLPGTRQLMKEIKTYLLIHLHRPPSLAALAAKFYLTEPTLRRQFLQYTGEPVHHFIVRARMEWAGQLLENGLSVGAVADKTGYKDISSFSRAFTRFFGYPPSLHKK